MAFPTHRTWNGEVVKEPEVVKESRVRLGRYIKHKYGFDR